METLQFLETVLGSDGWYCGCEITNHIKQKFYRSIEELESAAYETDANNKNAFFSLATFVESGSRKAENAKQLKSFFLDIDCGQGRDYPSKEEGLNALQAFCRKFNFPKPLMVDSGGGFHVYWVLSEAISVDKWQPIAEKLKHLCISNGLRIDKTVTADAARILRVPNTNNYKKETPRPVRICGHVPPTVQFEDFAKLVEEVEVPKSTIKVDSDMTSDDNAILQALMGNNQFSFRKILEKTKNGVGCGQLKDLIKNQESVGEPLWRAGLSIAKFCEDSDKAMYVMSHKHPEYDEDVTIAKAAVIPKPILCKTFDELNPGICANCPNNGKIRTPIVLGKEVMEASEEDNFYQEPEEVAPAPEVPANVIPTFPKPYFRGKNGGVYIRTTTAEGDTDERVIYHNDIYVVRRILDPEIGESIIMRLHLPKDGIREFSLPLTAASSREEFRKAMSMQGVLVTKMEDLMAYVATWVNQLQAQSTADESRRQFGWSKDNKSFILGKNEYTANGIQTNHPSPTTARYFPAFEPKGTLEGWKEMVAHFDKEGLEFHQFMICAGFGSVLMEFMPNINAVGMHLYSPESGFGKTSIMNVMNSIWGDYTELTISKEDTKNFSMNRAEVYKSLPLAIDEVTDMPPDQLSEFALGITGGKQRGRMSSGANTERWRGNPWSLISVTTANTSLIERVSTIKSVAAAEAQRIMEREVGHYNFDTEQSSIFDKLLQNNFGHAGPIFIDYVLNNMDKVKELMTNVKLRLDKVFGLSHQNRFWSAGITVTVAASIICKKLDLLPFDPANIRREAGLFVEENKRKVNAISKSVTEILGEFFTDNWVNMLRIKSTVDLRKGDVHENALDYYTSTSSEQPRYKYVARYETDIQTVYILPKPLREWCGKQRIVYGSFTRDMEKELNANIQGRIRMFRGTSLADVPAQRCIIINCKGIIDEEELNEKVKIEDFLDLDP
jgi:hypothetical protein